jgi:hypothetical protein
LLAQAGVLERAEISPSYAQMLRRIMSRPEGTERVASAGAAA